MEHNMNLLLGISLDVQKANRSKKLTLIFLYLNVIQFFSKYILSLLETVQMFDKLQDQFIKIKNWLPFKINI